MPTIRHPSRAPRAVTDADFPAGGPPEAQLAALLNWAVQAPSVLNTQPWRFRVEGRHRRGLRRPRAPPAGPSTRRAARPSSRAARRSSRCAWRRATTASPTGVEYPTRGIERPSTETDLVATVGCAGPSRPTGEEALFRRRQAAPHQPRPVRRLRRPGRARRPAPRRRRRRGRAPGGARRAQADNGARRRPRRAGHPPAGRRRRDGRRAARLAAARRRPRAPTACRTRSRAAGTA